MSPTLIVYLIETYTKTESGYELKIAMDKSNLTIDEWINYFHSESLYLKKERRVVDLLRYKATPVSDNLNNRTTVYENV